LRLSLNFKSYKDMATNKQPAKPAPTVLPDEEFNKKWDQENLYQNIKRTNDPRFGEITIVKNNSTNEVLFVKEKMASSKNEASNDIRELKSRIALNHPNMQKLVNYSTAVKKELCSTHYISRGFYEFPRSDCQKEHLERKRNLTGFSSSELTHLAYQGLDGLHHLHSRNITHGDIRPLTVGYHKAANQFQILDRLADPSPLEKLQASNIINKKELYVAPELYKKLQGKDKTLKYSAYKNDLYALGLTILFLGNSDSVQDIYKPNGEFDQNKLNEHIKNFEGKYKTENPYLCTIVNTLLAPNEADRPETQQLVSSLLPYDQYKIQETQGIKVHGANVHQEAPQHVEVIHQEPVATENFFSYNAPVVHAENHGTVIVNRAETDYKPVDQSNTYVVNSSNLNTTYDNTNVTYSYAQPTYTYAQAPVVYQSNAKDNSYLTNQNTTTYTYTQPTTTYTQPTTTYTQPTTTYTYAQPTTTYVQSEPVTYTYTQPTSYVQGETVTYSQPTTTYVQGENVTYTQPTTTYVQGENVTYTQPTNTYVQSENVTYTQPTTTYVQSEPVTYTYTQPSNIVYQTESYTKPNVTFVNAQVEAPKIERKSYATYTTTAPTEVRTIRRSYATYAAPQVITNETVPVSYVYSQPTNYVQQAPVSYIQGNTTYSYAQPSTYTSYAQYTPTTVERKVENAIPESMESLDSKTSDNIRTYYVNQPYTSYQTTPYQTSRVIYQSNNDAQYTTQYVPTEGTRVYTSYANPTTYIQSETPRVYDNNVEVRKGSFAPVNTQGEVKIVKKKYIIEGDKVIEVDVNENEQQENHQ